MSSANTANTTVDRPTTPEHGPQANNGMKNGLLVVADPQQVAAGLNQVFGVWSAESELKTRLSRGLPEVEEEHSVAPDTVMTVDAQHRQTAEDQEAAEQTMSSYSFRSRGSQA